MSRTPSAATSGIPQEADVRPVVAVRGRDRSAWLFAAMALVAAVLLFVALDARRRALSEPEGSAGEGPALRDENVPDLVLPNPPAEQVQAQGPWLTPEGRANASRPEAPAAPARASNSYRPAPPPAVTAPPAYYPPAPLIVSQQPEPSIPGVNGPASRSAGAASKAGGAGRVMADRLAHPSDTVPQGTLISAVLETGLDSTGAGQARALVTRDVYGFDGTRLLIPRGSRLYGTYEAGIELGEKRAQISWTRLLRPDGATIALDSPAADPLGRAGVKGKVDGHFFQRLGNALLASTVGFGNALISRRVSPVIVVPGATGQAGIAAPVSNTDIKPTLHIKPGARVSVFVQHDLDFSSLDDEPQ